MQPNRRQTSIVALLIGLWAGIQQASAQYTTSFQTNTISGATTTWTGNYIVGSNTLADTLLIRSAGVLSNADGYVGYLPASVSNFVMVAGAGSVWTNANLFLGYSGSANTLIISNAGRVANSQLIYVANDATSSNNRVLVTGTNSIWDCANNLTLGVSGSANSLIISNSGRVNDGWGQLGAQATSSGNTALVTGTNSLWNNSSLCTVGGSGSNNKLTISRGGHMVCNSAVIGTWAGATNNSILVSDTNSLWDDSAEASVLSFGANASGNSLVVTNGGQVLGYYAYFGRLGTADNNSALVTGPGSSFSVNCYIYTGDQGHNNSFTVANGATVSDKFCHISYSAGSSNNSVLVTGTNSSWQNSYSVFVGFDGSGGSLTISNGATISTGGAWATSHDGALGVDATSSNNRALVTGGGSVLNCADNLYDGLNGTSNSLVISNGGRVINTEGYVGSNPGSDNNRALVTGTNSVWTNQTDLYVGDFSSGNSLVISNGGWVVNGYAYLGRVAGSVNNSILVTGTNSVWTNHANVYVGCFGSGNSLVISNGGRVIDDYGTVGYDTNSFDNAALVAGAGTVWSNSTVVFVGDFGSTNSLEIRDGAVVLDYYGLVGEEDSSYDNTVYVNSGGVWRNGELCVGDMGSHNAMFVDGGSVFVTNYMAVGYNPLYYNNLVELDNGLIAVTNRAHDAELEVYGGGFLLTGGTLIVDNLVITNDGAQFMYIGGTLIYRTLTLNPAQDTDSDGIPNGWEQTHGLDPLNPDDAGLDPDKDGMSSLQEYLAGTNPTNAASCLTITSLTLTNNGVRVRWSAVGGKRYVVQTNSNMGTSFVDASPVIAAAGTVETTTNYLDPGAATNSKAHYYRVRIAP